MNNVSTPDGRGQDRPNDAQPFFPSEGSFSPVVPLSEVGRAPAAHRPVDAADLGRPAEADWARAAHRARLKEDEETLVPGRRRAARGARPSWLVPAAVVVLSVTAGLASGTYLIWSSQSAPDSQTPVPIAAEAPAAEAPTLPPPPAPEPETADAKVERVSEPVKEEKPGEVAKSEKAGEAARPTKQAPPPQPEPAPRAERVARAAAEPKETAPEPKPARTTRSAAPARTRPTTAARQTPAPA
ncbi:MAG TPA: hypothetical protein VF586_13010, partial [Pyrinomonadaceae bacterium]